jgi:poly-gamma-glutamate synthesis protein (capsule biosynthesis protein)
LKRKILQNTPFLAFLLLFILFGISLTPKTVTLAFLGDVMLGRGVAFAHQQGDWDTTFAYLTPRISSANIALANLESPLTDMDMVDIDTYDLRAPRDSVRALNNAGIDVLSLTNNHSLDAGIQGLEDTSATLSTAGLYKIPTTTQPLYITIQGIPFAFFAFEDIIQPLDIEKSCQAIRKEHSKGKKVIVSIHWGNEYRPYADTRQQHIAQVFADCGATFIWGHHPHVLEPVVWLRGKGQTYPIPVVYSLGNAIFDQFVPSGVRYSALVLITLSSEKVESIKAFPFVILPQRGIVIPADADITDLIQHRLGNDIGMIE